MEISQQESPNAFDLLTPRGDFQLLKRSLLNERVAPEVLDYKAGLVDRVNMAMQHQEYDEDESQCSSSEQELVQQVLSSERSRVRWLLKAYLRTRLDKIERYAGHLLNNAGGVGERLSPQERVFCSSYFVSTGRLMKDSVLDDLPGPYQSLVKRYDAEEDEARKLLDTPDLRKYVFCNVLQDCGQVADGGDGRTAELHAADMLAVKYETIAPLVQSGQVCCL